MEPRVREVYETIGRYANYDGIAWPSLDRLKSHLRRTKRTVFASVRSLEYSGHIQVTPGHQRCPNRYRLMRPGTNEPFIPSPNGVRQDSTTVPSGTVVESWNGNEVSPGTVGDLGNRDMVPPGTETPSGDPVMVPSGTETQGYGSLGNWKIERELVEILDRLRHLLSLIPPEGQLWFRRELKLDVMVPPGTITGPDSQLSVPEEPEYGPASGPLVPNPSFDDYQRSQEMQARRWLDDHWTWIQSQTEWRHLKALQDHCLKNPGELRRLEDAYQAYVDESAQPGPMDSTEEQQYPTLDPEEASEEEAAEVWMQVLVALKEQLPGPSFSSYLQDTAGHALDVGQGTLQVICPSAWVAQVIERRLYGSVERQAERVVGTPVEIYFLTRPAA